MSDTNIEWTQKSWNPIVGCSIKSAGCTNCYAMSMAYRLAAMGVDHYQGLTHKVNGNAVWTGKLALNEKALLEPLRRRKPTTYFVNSMGDLFHEDCPDEWIDRVFAVMALCPQHTFQVLTKRSARMREYLANPETPQRIAIVVINQDEIRGEARLAPLRDRAREEDASFVAMPLPNVWLGVSVEDQRAADERVPDLLATPAAIRWISAEPLLGPVDFRRIMEVGAEECFHTIHPLPLLLANQTWSETRSSLNALTGHYWGEDLIDDQWEPWCDLTHERERGFGGAGFYPGLDWIVVGGESGKDARPMHPDWARSLRDQCAAAGVPYFFKQWGEYAPCQISETGELDPPMPMSGPHLMKWRRWEGGVTRPAEPKESVRTWFAEGTLAVPLGKKTAGRLLDGTEHNAMPVQP